ncbi:trichohyalin [Drosophila navojoa]|uniref:trichohyalin n=1 Tax=Drosophila navojoa TaxID=7232 RepID=UPI000846D24D|nr:trichohyalin [Drosophila navojoa]XP_017961161.1 trichohyalin [Drosophila navojoa]
MPPQPQHQQGPTTTTTTTAAAATTTANGGPRVSFNRDVHVKRIAKRPNEPSEYDYETTDLAPIGLQGYHQLPPDIDPEDIRKEAALVIAQAGQHQSKAANGDNIPTFRVKQKPRPSSSGDAQRFHSLPTRRKKGKPVARSVSDASAAKKPAKRPSIFGLFSRKSDTNVSQLERDPRFEEGPPGRRLVRSKSDVGSTPKESRSSKVSSNSKKNEPASTAAKQQLSPIIEQTQREDFFEQDYFRERERRKSDAVTVREKHESGQGLSELLSRSRSKAELDGSLLKRQAIVGASATATGASISAGIRDRIETLKAKSSENMHSSQQPAERLPLTRGRTVNGLVKRLSMERFSPQPVISQPAFSYIRPNEGITYAQLDLSDEPQQQQQHQRVSGRDSRTPQREFPPPRPPRANDRPLRSYSPIQNGGVGAGGAGTPSRLTSSLSPSPWQQLSPRNLSDEDEGLGFETRKLYYEEDLPKQERRAEPPIVPVIRSVSPAPYLDELGYRRAQLENRILTRRFGEGATLERQHNYTKQERDRFLDYPSPERERERERECEREREMERELAVDERYHRPVQLELESSTTLPKMEKSSRYRHTKYYDDGNGGIKETYVRETQRDGQVRESRHRERLGSSPRELEEQEPKSLDSQLTVGTDQYRSSPELRSAERGRLQDYWQSSLKRDKLQQRSFDKGDSGIENDFRKESFNGDLTTRWRKRTALDDMRACESFLRKERRESAQQLQELQRLRREHSYVYRERSIDDGSHFDPHLDKYTVSTSTLRRREQQQQQQKQREDSSTLKRNKKLGGFEKVKQLFIGSGGGGSNGGSGRSSGSNVSSGKKDTQSRLTNGSSSTLSRRDKDKERSRLEKEREREREREKERYMVREEEMRSRYREHHHQTSTEETSREPKTMDISMRRRLSTPKASPLLLKKPPKQKPTLTSATSTPVKAEKTSWFKSLDRRAKSNPKEQLNVSVNGHSEVSSSSLKRSKRNANAAPAPAKNLRFFGDTDLDSNPPTISKASSMPRRRPQLSKHSHSAYHLDRSPPPPSRDYRQSLSTSAATTSLTPGAARQRASSMQHLEHGSDEVDFRKRRHYSRSRELHDISESGSEPEPVERHKRGAAQRAMSLERSTELPKRYEDRPLLGPPKPARSAERRGLTPSAVDGGYGKERYPAESSGTEGESSLHSQRSVVYLHATTVGDIPQPYNLRRRSMSRDDLRKGGGAGGAGGKPPLQPMTRTVSRSVSMLAPWKPKHISEGYEINYSQEQNKRISTLPRKPPPHNGATSASTLSRLGRKQESSASSSSAHRRLNGYSVEERPAPTRSLLSASNLRTAKTK